MEVFRRFDGRFSRGLINVCQEVRWKFIRRLDDILSGEFRERCHKG